MELTKEETKYLLRLVEKDTVQIINVGVRGNVRKILRINFELADRLRKELRKEP